MDENRARELLLAERAEVADLLKKTEAAEVADRDAGGVRDYADEAEPLTEEAEEDSIAADLSQRLAAIDRALGRLDNGTYGQSVLSGRPIPDERLEADPAAELTVEEARISRR